MKNLKKVLAFVVVFAMMFSLAVSANTFPDVSDDASYANAATVLNGIGLMIGDDQGNFNPDKTITRAEAATIVVRAKALGNAAAGAKGATAFKDVPADHWASGFINMATQSGIVAGYGDGTFGPEDPVTYEQMVKLIVAALGYTPKAETNGGYPTGYLVVASQKEITKGATGSAGEPALRKTVARLVYNALDVGMMEQTTWGTEERINESGRTLLDLLNISKIASGVVSSSYITEGNYDPAEDKDVTIGGNTYLVGETDAAGMYGYKVEAYYAYDEDTDKDTILAIVSKSAQNSTVELDYSQIDKFAAGVVNYDDDKDLEISATAKYLYNGLPEDDGANAIQFIQANQNNKIRPGKVVFIDNNADDKYDYVVVTEYTESYVVGEINASKKIIEGLDATGTRIDLTKEDRMYTFYKDGALADFEDVKEGDVVTLAANGKYCTVYISDATVEGSVDEATSDADQAFEIDGSLYKLDYKNAAVSALVSGISTGDEGKFYLNVDNRIVYKEIISSKTGNYAYLYKADIDSDTFGKDKIALRYFTSEGNWEEANLASKISVYQGNNGATSFDPIKPDADQKKALSKIFVVGTTSDTADANGKFTVNAITEKPQLFKYQKNSSGEINKIYVANATAMDDYFSLDHTSAAADKYIATTNTLGSAYLDDNTIVFNLPKAADWDNEDNFSVSSVKAIFSDNEVYAGVESYDEGRDGYAAILVAVDAKPSIDDETRVLVLTRIATGLDSNGNEVTKFYGYQEGQSVSAEASENIEVKDIAGGDFDLENLKAGDAVIFSLDSKGAISKMKVLITAAEAKANAFAYDGADGQYAKNYFGRAYQKKSNYRATLLLGGVTEQDLTLKGDYEVYRVNVNKDTAKVEVSSYSEIDFDNRAIADMSKGDTIDWMYVRMYDNVPVDIVVYTYTK